MIAKTPKIQSIINFLLNFKQKKFKILIGSGLSHGTTPIRVIIIIISAALTDVDFQTILRMLH
jgi:hypothetical protein